MSLGERIKQARKASRLSQRDLAAQVQVSAMAISKYERDQAVPGSEVLLRLAQALNTSVDFFFRPAGPEVQLQAYRKHASLSVKAQEALQACIQDWLERYLAVEGFFPHQDIKLELPRYPVSAFDEIEMAANHLRATWQLGLDPIENLTQLLEDRGLKVGLISGFDHFDACTFMANQVPVIVTKGGLPGDRQRFNLGHELGHLVLDVDEALDGEKAANRFVGAFLAPASAVQFELGRQRSTLDMNELYLLKHKYGLSMQAWIFRAQDLGILSTSAAQTLFRKFSTRGWHKQEPGEAYPPEAPLRMERLIYRALVEDLISRSRAQELLGKPLPDRGLQ